MSDERIISYSEAIREAIMQEMERDENVVFLGQDISGGGHREKENMTDTWGGSFGVSRGISTRFGIERVIDCPLSEAGYIGAAVSASTAGLNVIAELMFNDFLWLAGDQLFNGAAKIKYLSGGKQSCKLTIRTVTGAGLNAGMHHSQSLYALAAHIPGIKIAIPSTPYDAKGLLVTAIRGDEPVIIFENKTLYNTKGHVPEESYEIPIGKAKIVKNGKDATIVTISRMLFIALEAADILEKKGVFVEIIDCVSLVPLDEETIIRSVSKTGHLVIVDEATPRCGAAADIAAMAADKAIDYLDGPIKLVTSAHTPVPFSPVLEKIYMPDSISVVNAVLNSLD